MLAHISEDQLREQTVAEHTQGVYELCGNKGRKLQIANIAQLCAIFHDIGKEKKVFDDYIKADIDVQRSLKGKIEHSSSGAKYVFEKYHTGDKLDVLLSEIISYAVAAHHGVFDCVNKQGSINFTHRIEQVQNFEEVCHNSEEEILSKYDIDKIYDKAKKELYDVFQKIISLIKKEQSGKTEIKRELNFYLACFQRLVLSILIDSDWEDTAKFMREIESVIFESKEVFAKASNNFQKYMETIKVSFSKKKRTDKENEIFKIRNEIQNECIAFAKNEVGIYRLSIPTGGGKTLSGLSYALAFAKEHPGTERIFYIAPFISVIEQNVDVIKKAVGNDEWVLEHHSSVIRENEMDDKNVWTDFSWEEPFVCTTFVQFMNTLFSDKKQAIRRMHRLTNSVIIIDEVQAIPVKCVYTFNYMMNFLQRVCNANIVLCTATQPELDYNKFACPILYSQPTDMISNLGMRFKQFERVKVIPQKRKKNYKLCELAEEIGRQVNTYQSILVVLNTKDAVSSVYNKLNEIVEESVHVEYLTTNLCAEHRSEKIKMIKLGLEDREHGGKWIVVSTNLIEAGVDISFECVYRSMAGLDSVAQTAGRCNRNGERERGDVFIVNVEDENKGRMEELLDAINATQYVLTECDSSSSILSPQYMKTFYKQYFFMEEYKMSFPIEEYDTNIFKILSMGFKEREKTKFAYIKQAYKTAGRYYQVIDQSSVGVIVPYGEGRQIVNQVQEVCNYREMKLLIRKAQRYTVNIPQYKLEQYCEKGIISPCKEPFSNIYFATHGSYNKDMGMTGEIEDLFF